MTTPTDRTPNQPGQTNPYLPPSFAPTGPPDATPPPSINPPPPKKRRIWLIALAAVTLFFVLAGIIAAALAGQSDTGKTTGSTAPAATWDAGEEGVAPAEATTEPAAKPAVTPKAKDFALRAKITEKKCYGYGVGCSVGFKVQAEYSGPALDADDTWLVVYEVTGIEDGPLVGSFELTGDTYAMNEEYVSTKSTKSKITIKVTSVEKVGI